MIEKMNVVYVVAQAKNRKETVAGLRDMGILHLARTKPPDEHTADRVSTISKLLTELKEYAPKTKEEMPPLSDEEFDALCSRTVEALDRKAEQSNRRAECLLEYEKIKEWGDFDSGSLKELQHGGLDFHFYRIGKKEYRQLCADDTVRFIRLKPVEKSVTVAVLGELPAAFAANEFAVPQKSVSALLAEMDGCAAEIERCEHILTDSAKHLKAYADKLLSAQNDYEFSAVEKTLDTVDELVWLKGYIPAADTETFTAAAKKQGWAYCVEDAAPDDPDVPTKIRYNKLTKLVEPVFDILGTVPGYGEYDISFWFLAFFTLFFAMIIGDAGYGVLFLLAAVGITLKIRKVTNATLLLFVLSVGTVVWGALTGTWFGLEKAMDIPLLRSMVIPSIANYPERFGQTATAAQNGVMRFCFSIGAIQLALACVMNVRRKIAQKNLSFIADIGWLVAICALYFMVLYLVIGQSVNITAVAVAVILGFLLVVFFGGMAPDKSFVKGLTSGLSDTFTTFLNTISAFGNVMSYIRLFAVGMASLAIAQSFNDMASGFDGALVIVGAFIMILGHLLNIIMGFLSVVVHGVRLNLLEFSGQLGMEWSGTAYAPFRKREKYKK